MIDPQTRAEMIDYLSRLSAFIANMALNPQAPTSLNAISHKLTSAAAMLSDDGATIVGLQQQVANALTQNQVLQGLSQAPTS
jgi:hypothetical protein